MNKKIDEKYDLIFKDACQINVKQLKNMLDSDSLFGLASLMPKKSIALSTNYFKDISTTKDTRTLILIIHLYLENVINAIIKEKFVNSEEIKGFTFYQKIKILKATDIIANNISNDILYINSIRNKFAHNLNYDASLIDFLNFSKLAQINKMKKYKMKIYQIKYNHFMLVIYSMYLLMKLSEEFPLIHLLNVEI